MDYKNGKIYKITSNSTDKIYIGSTCQTLCLRISQHRKGYKIVKNGNKTRNMSSYELIALGDAIITLIEDYPCERKEQLHARERYHIELNKDICINKCIPTRTIKEYEEDNKDKISAKNKEYYQQNKDKILERVKNYVENSKEKINCLCGSSIFKHNKSIHERSKKHLDYIQSQS